MAWGRMDDGFDDHPKVVALLDEDDLTTAGVAIGLWTLCWTWAHRNTRKRGKTPGLIPPGLPRRFFGQAGKDAVQLLVKHRLWDAVDDGGWLIHDFEDFLPTEETREARAEAGRRGAAVRWAGHQKVSESDETTFDHGKVPSACHDADSNPVASDGSRAPAHRGPTPIPTPIPNPDLPSEDLFGAVAPGQDEKSKQPTRQAPKVACRIPDDFAVDEAMTAWATGKAPSVDWPAETENFVDYWTARARDDTKKDWVAAWRTWMRNAQKDLVGRGITRRWSPDTNQQGRAGSDLARRPTAGADPIRRSTSAARAEQALSVADELDREYGHGRYAQEGTK